MHKRFQSHKPPTTSAFTIIELLIVIVVIGILATITIVAYNNIQQRARTAALTSSLSQAATKLKTYDIEIGSYPENLTDINIHSSEAVTYIYHKDNNSNPRSFCITAIKNNLVYKVTDTTQPSPGGCGMHTWPGGVVMTNLVENGDFSEGIAGWSGPLSLTAADKTLTHTASDARYFGETSRLIGPISPGDKLYVGATMRVSGPASSVLVTAADTQNRTVSIKGSAAADTWYSGSGILTMAGGHPSNAAFKLQHVYPDAATAAGKRLDVRWALAINLTATFGAGNEPTKEQMDQILQQFPNGWFGGTVTAYAGGVL